MIHQTVDCFSPKVEFNKDGALKKLVIDESKIDFGKIFKVEDILMDKIYVVDGATLQCSFGSEESIFKVSPGRESYTNGQLQANTGDFKPMVNIMTFKKCSSPSNPAPVIGTDDKGRPQKICTPVITMPWLNLLL